MSADENGITAANSLSGIGRIGNLLGAARRLQYLVQVALENGYLAGLQLRDAPAVNIATNDVVAGFCETCPGYQTNVSATNDRKAQARSPKIALGDVRLIPEACANP
jgi:hypothetical protein